MKFLIRINLLACIVLVFWYPHLMISPGKLLEGHQDLTTDCLSCHSLFRGSSSEKCIACHTVADIGLVTTQGVPLQKDNRVSFHQTLVKQDCVACHTDHQGMQVYRSIQRFSHDSLSPSLRNQCDSCHQKPTDALHQQTARNCDQCHNQTQWKPATFNHAQLSLTERNNCSTCHPKPTDALHQQITGNCDQCHSETQWKPARFVDHDQYFRFDKHHPAECVRCHLNNDYSQYSCYECHEHSPSKIREEHLEEGIYDYENCTECHRSGDEDEAERIWKSKGQPSSHDDHRSKRHHDEDDDDDD